MIERNPAQAVVYLIWLNEQGRVLSLDKVQKEIFDGKEQDVLKNWVKDSKCFAPCEDPDVLYWYAKMQEWAQAQPQYFPAAKAEFASDPDAWIVAYAKAKHLTLVTQETYAPDVKRSMPIPNVCKAKEFMVNWIDAFIMLSSLGIKFNWKE